MRQKIRCLSTKNVSIFLFYLANGQWLQKKPFFSIYFEIRIFKRSDCLVLHWSAQLPVINEMPSFYVRRMQTQTFGIFIAFAVNRTHTHTQHAKRTKAKLKWPGKAWKYSKRASEHNNEVDRQSTWTESGVAAIKSRSGCLKCEQCWPYLKSVRANILFFSAEFLILTSLSQPKCWDWSCGSSAS